MNGVWKSLIGTDRGQSTVEMLFGLNDFASFADNLFMSSLSSLFMIFVLCQNLDKSMFFCFSSIFDIIHLMQGDNSENPNHLYLANING